MRIFIRPTKIDFVSGEPTEFAVSVVGIAPHKTYFIEQTVATVTDKSHGPSAVGEHIIETVKQQAIMDAINEHGHAKAQQMMQTGELTVQVPQIPGVTVPGEWVNPKYGNPERHRQLYGMKTRSPEAERQVIGSPESFTA